MNATQRPTCPALLVALACSLFSGPLLAGTEVRVKVKADEVGEPAEPVLDEIQIGSEPVVLAEDHALAAATTRSGARVLASVEHHDRTDCELAAAEATDDEHDIEARFLRLMQTR
jgi:hypothetical protein